MILFAILIASSCDKDVDGITPGDFNYIVVNGTGYNIHITTEPISVNGKINPIELSPRDSFVSKGYYEGFGDPRPFPAGAVYITFGDSIVCECQPNLEEKCMINTQKVYQCLQNGPDVYTYRYIITEEDYEYAKAHPYKGE